MTYSERLKDPRWQKRRLKVMEYAHWRCQICGTKDNTLHCHHSYYSRGKLPWQYPDGAIICICEACHEKIHGKRTLAPAPPESPQPPLKPEPAATAQVRVNAKEAFAKIRAALQEMAQR